jgi:hypothetical protein
MKYTSLAACGALTLAATLTASAQAPVQPPTTRPQPPAPTQPAATVTHPITVTGCLTPWDNAIGKAPVDPAVTPGSTPMAGTRYVLMVEAEKPAAPAGTPPAATPPATPPAATAPPAHPQISKFVVSAAPGVDLAAHVNHKVRVTGTVETAKEPPTTPAATGRPGDPAPAAKVASEQDWAPLTATAVTMVSATCAAKS